jgi:predicted house-cleaning NTP pyrophosphatase (Maf/HAM1 superfamily)
MQKRKLEALRILETKLAAVEQVHGAEDNGDMREQIDATAEAKALAAVFDFLKDCKVRHTDSLLRILERYLRKPKLGRAAVKR